MMQLLRMLGILLGMLLAVGFGLCGAFGVVVAAGNGFAGGFDPATFTLVLIWSLIGLLIGLACGRAAWSALKARPGAGASSAE